MATPFDSNCPPGTTLGTGQDLRVFLTTRGATALLAELPVTAGNFTRKLDATSECQIEGVFAGNDPSCCLGWTEVVPWATELLVLRDGRDAWAGPVTDVVFARGKVTVQAADLSAWWDRRTVPTMTFTQQDPCDIFLAIHEAAMAPDPIPNFTPWRQKISGMKVDRSYKNSDYQYASDALNELAKTEVDWTCFGRTLVMCSQAIDAPPYATLLDDWWDEPPQVAIHGNEQATEVIVKCKEPIVGHWRAPQATIDQVGLIVRVFSETNIEDQFSADMNAMTRGDFLSQPTYITPPQGATLRTSAPITLGELIPGIRVRVDTSATCRRVVGDFRLETVNVNFDGKVTIDLSPLGHMAEDGTTIDAPESMAA